MALLKQEIHEDQLAFLRRKGPRSGSEKRFFAGIQRRGFWYFHPHPPFSGDYGSPLIAPDAKIMPSWHRTRKK